VDAFRKRLVGFKTAVKIARLKEGANLECPERHRARDRRLYEAWKRFHEESCHMFDLDPGSLFPGLPSAPYLDYPTKLLKMSVEDDDLEKGAGPVKFQYGRLLVTIERTVWTRGDTKWWIAFYRDRGMKVELPPYREGAKAVRAALKQEKFAAA